MEWTDAKLNRLKSIYFCELNKKYDKENKEKKAK